MRVDVAERVHTKGDVLENLHEHTAHPEHDQGTEVRIGGHTHHQFRAIVDHGLNFDTGESCLGTRFA